MRWLRPVTVLLLLAAAGTTGYGAAPAAAAPGPTAAPEYWFDAWQVPELWAAGVRGQGVTIAEIDTGVNAALPELTGRVLSGTDLGRSGDGRTDRQVDTFGHGTAMASIMVGRSGLFGITGIAPGAKILPIAVPLEGTVDENEPDDLPRAIRYAADHGAKVISMSLGGKRTPSADSAPCPPDEQAAVFHAMAKGAVVLASVGNTGPTANTVEEPGVCLGVVSVGAVDSFGHVASFSGRQPYLSLVAPGVDVPSLGRIPGQAFSGDGTSQATALASAAVALVWSKYPALTGRAVVARLLATLTDRHRTPDPKYGYGRLDTYRAVTADVPATAPNPVYDLAAPFMARATAFGRARLGAPPRPAGSAHPRQPTAGTFTVGSSTPWATAGVLGGLAAVAAGTALLALLLVTGRRARRTRRRVAAAGDVVPPELVLAAGPTVAAPAGPQLVQDEVDDAAPRPLPGSD